MVYVIYRIKIVSKTNILKKVTHKIDSPLQGAFIQGSNIHDNILVPHEILYSFTKTWNKQWLMAIKLGGDKAYDRI